MKLDRVFKVSLVKGLRGSWLLGGGVWGWSDLRSINEFNWFFLGGGK